MENKLENLLEEFSKLNITYLKYQGVDFSLELSKDSLTKSREANIPSVNESIITRENKVEVLEAANEKLEKVKSPMVGIFYSRMSPESEVLVNLGDSVKEGQVLCIIEAMKMFNEITSPFNGTIRKINFKDGDLVEFDDVLFEVGN